MKFEETLQCEAERMAPADEKAKVTEKEVSPPSPAKTQGEATEPDLSSARTQSVVQGIGASGEPWVARSARDHVGLALSGGGIRSASFSLGLLQALDELGVLRLVDYLSTVSGGGYTGGFWTAWLGRDPERKPDDEHVFPRPTHFAKRDTPEARAPETQEPLEIRHLRQFSRFLAPRSSVIHVDVWEAALAVIVGAIPTLLTTICVVAGLLMGWRFVSVQLQYAWLGGGESRVAPLVAAPIVLCVWLGYLEWRWRGLRLVEPAEQRKAIDPTVELPTQNQRNAAGWIIASVAGVVACAGAASIIAGLPPLHTVASIDRLVLCHTTTWARLLDDPTACMPLANELVVPLVLALAAAILSVIRGVVPSYVSPGGVGRRNDPASFEHTLERTAARLAFLAVALAAVGATWMMSGLVSHAPHLDGLLDALPIPTSSDGAAKASEGAPGMGELVTTGLVSGALTLLFSLLKDRLLAPPRDGEGPIGARVRAFVPQVVAFLAALCLLAFVGIGCRIVAQALIDEGASMHLFWLLVPAVVVLFALDWPRIGLREFYRRRLARAFVLSHGEEPPGDSDWLCRKKKEERPTVRPIHLVCCAANDVGSDPLSTLYRGARSAVLSAEGLTIGLHTRSYDIRLSDALTASAAAFNTQMGGASLRLGRAVSFLMGAFNLRLGLWLRREDERAKNLLLFIPGFRLLAEMLGVTRQRDQWVHLSDGGHFENLGLYELVRRHCRYVIVSDAGADPDVSFDDLGNAIRRVREDFGVEIEIDVDPLRPDEHGRSRQHVVVGTIHYDRRDGVDKGALVYVKPTLTGDEPPDVMQYRARNSSFPHESTGDQFFDEPQWESYRRLGEHCGRTAFRHVGSLSKAQVRRRERVFSEAARVWHAIPADYEDKFLVLSERCTAIEAALRSEMPEWLRAEFASEIAGARASEPAKQKPEELVKAFAFMVEVTQLMEDAWLACHLDSHWAHPLNEGWLGYLHRWAAMPTFRMMWPLLRPMYAGGFREFVKQRFGLKVVDPDLPDAPAVDEGTARLELRPGLVSGDEYTLAYHLVLAGRPLDVKVGEATVRVRASEEDGTRFASWSTRQLVVDAKLHGAGVVGKFLDHVLAWCGDEGAVRAEVTLSAGGDARSNALTVDLYRSCGFLLEVAEEGKPPKLIAVTERKTRTAK